MQEPGIRKFFRPPTYFLVAGSVVSLSALLFAGQPILAKQMDEWRLLPRPERVTELYFTDYRQLPESVSPRSEQAVRFTVRNLEHRTTAYRYTLTVISEDDMVERPADRGSFSLAHGQSFEASGTVTIPASHERVAVRVNLEYEGIAFGKDAPSTQKQVIHYWTAIAGPDGHDKDSDEGA